MSNNKICLSPSEMYLGAQAGVLRHLQNLQTGQAEPTFGMPAEKDWQAHVEGCLAEQAVAKYLNIYWEGKGRRGGLDVGPWQVRNTPQANGCLVVRDKDREDQVYWLVTGLNGRYTVRGWTTGEKAKKDEYKMAPNNRPPAYFVPQAELHSPAEIP